MLLTLNSSKLERKFSSIWHYIHENSCFRWLWICWVVCFCQFFCCVSWLVKFLFGAWIFCRFFFCCVSWHVKFLWSFSFVWLFSVLYLWLCWVFVKFFICCVCVLGVSVFYLDIFYLPLHLVWTTDLPLRLL